MLHLYYRKRKIDLEHGDDATQTIFSRIWDNRASLHFESAGRWYGYIYTAVRNFLKDVKDDFRPPVESIDPKANTWEQVIKLLEAEGLYELADRTWLGKTPSDGVAKALVATMIYVHGDSPAAALEWSALTSASYKPQKVEELEEWIGDLWVLRKVAYNALYLRNELLVAFLLGVPNASTEELNQLQNATSTGNAPGGWHWDDIAVVMMRYRHGISLLNVERKIDPPIERNKLLAIDDRCRSLFPFVDTMTTVWTSTELHPLREKAFAENPLWKRLVFQYHCADNLPQDEILARISDAAGVTGYRLRNINTWIADRLEQELTRSRQQGALN